MKINNKLIIILLAAIINLSCNDFLDTRIDTNMTPEDLETNAGTLWAFAAAFYTPITYGFEVLDNNLFAAVTDEAQQTSVSGNVYYFTKGMINADVNPLSHLYTEYYEGIRAANYFMEFAKNGEDLLKWNRDTVRHVENYRRDLRRLGWHRAESQIAKAYYYSELIKMYGGVPIVDKLLSSDTQNANSIPRSSYDEVVEHIVQLIDNNLENLQDDWRTEEGLASMTGLFDQPVALAIKSRTLLYAASPLNNPSNDVKKWQRAAKAAHDLIVRRGYPLPENRDYRALFAGNNPVQSPEVIWAIRRPDNNFIETNNYPISTPGGASGVTPSHNLVSAYEYIGTPDAKNPYANRDPRLQATIVVNGSRWNGRNIDQSFGGSDDMRKANTSKTGYYLKKFLTDELNLIQGGQAQHQWIVFRFAEIFLNYAEAMNEAYGPDGLPDGYVITAREALNQVRRSASTNLPPVTTTDKNEFRKAVKHERRIELAFEDHRYWDLLRWKDAATVLNQPITGVKVTKNSANEYQYQVVNVGERVFMDRNYRFPFTRNEIKNSNGSMIQNEGY